MTFFNKKEDVIAIELTPHGRSLLSRGKLKPTFYAFFDDDILYDSQKGGFSETNSQSKNRILNETPYVRPQSNYKGVESRISDQRVFETENHLLSPIGSNKIDQKKTNGWDVTFLHNTASSAAKCLNESTSPILQIPQIETTITYTLKLSNTDAGLSNNGFRLVNESLLAAGPQFVDLREEQIMLHLLETNGFNENENLDIEVYLFEQDKQTFKQLSKFEEESPIQNDIYSEVPSNNNKSLFAVREKIYNPEMVEYWLNIKVDDEIPLSDRCSGLKNIEDNNIYLGDELVCPDEPGAIADIYSPSVTDVEDCEE